MVAPFFWNLGLGSKTVWNERKGPMTILFFFPGVKRCVLGVFFSTHKSSTHSPHHNAGMTYGPICLSLTLWPVKLILEWKVVDFVFPKFVFWVEWNWVKASKKHKLQLLFRNISWPHLPPSSGLDLTHPPPKREVDSRLFFQKTLVLNSGQLNFHDQAIFLFKKKGSFFIGKCGLRGFPYKGWSERTEKTQLCRYHSGASDEANVATGGRWWPVIQFSWGSWRP